MTYFWVLGYSDAGKRVLLGPYPNERKAEEAVDYLVEAEIHPLNTRDQQKAARILKAEIMAEGTDADEALQRQLHNKGLQHENPKYTSITRALARGGDDIFEGDPFKD